MNDAVLKNYATWARRELIEGVKLQMARWAIDEKGSMPASTETLHGEPLSAQQRAQRARLLEMCDEEGFDGLAEKAAYTWFNRLTAIRFMEVNDYLPCGMRMLSAADGSFDSQALREALHVDIEGLDRAVMAKLVQEGEREPQFRYLLLCQCNELASCMPDIFEPIGSAMELLLPDDLLREGSVVERMVLDIPDPYWKEGVEILGWMYQYYNAELKDEFFKSKRKAAQKDIAPATQLFTPNWIVRYMVENSLGRLWMLNNPDSALREHMDYYIESDGDHEDFIRIAGPEDITFCDPACGSGHILVYAFSLLFEMYLERGYREREIPELILTKNLSGLEIDDRAAQIASLALVMCAREHDRRFFTRDVAIDVHVVKPVVFGKNKNGEEVRPVPRALEKRRGLIDALTYLDEIGSLFAPSASDMAALDDALAEIPEGDMFAQDIREHLELAKEQCKALSRMFDVVVANPPYMGSSSFNSFMSKWMKKNYPDSYKDLCTAFIERGYSLARKQGYAAMVTMQSWMFLGSFEKMRGSLLDNKSIITMAHLGPRAFDAIGGEVVSVTAGVVYNGRFCCKGAYFRLVDIIGSEPKRTALVDAIQNPDCGWFYRADASTFHDIPGSPIAYWASEAVRNAFAQGAALSSFSNVRQGLRTGDNDYFLKLWWEIGNKGLFTTCHSTDEAISSKRTWFPHNKGGEFRKWYGNNDYVIRFNRDAYQKLCVSGNCLPSKKFYFQPSVTWSTISSGKIAFRYKPTGHLFDGAGNSIFADEHMLYLIQGALNSSSVGVIAGLISPTLSFEAGQVATYPIPTIESRHAEIITSIVQRLRIASSADWDIQETSWDFKRNSLI